ncbi:M1 family metallopeptidase [Calothrix sp. NIES-3974]|uniref:M1 family metallopeptidase n=1 Tax=Calothrix sp. NIES-3974 TaxID=2005462 RepID=UPI000B61CB0C|nr:M1 family metallopeptidase [Calothrix sp. NIES-3974]BAZ03813.1 peptidase M1 membrane alanine aminopeptidase [Calothrix sp. NIES-3974]
MLHSYFDTEKPHHKSFELPGARPHYNPDRPGQVKHIFLDLDLDIPHSRYSGTCTITLVPIRDGVKSVTLDAVDLTIGSIQVNQVPQRYDYDGEKLTIYLETATEINVPLEIAIAYSNQNPQRGIYFIHPDPYYPHKPVQVWTQGEDEDSRFWFPCFDYPGQLSTSEIRVCVPQDFMAVSNGELIKTEELAEKKIYHWLQKEVHPTYLMTLTVGRFSEIRDAWHDKPVTYYVEKGREADAKRSMGKTPRMMEFLSEKYGYPYPYAKYAQVCVDDFIFGGMENTSTTVLTDRCLLDERAAIDNRNSESLVVHELAHQWFGDLLVIKHWSHAWVKEGMATYSETMWTEYEYGREEAAYYRLQDMRSYLAEDADRYRRPMVTHVYREAIELYDRHIYEKGACVYHMIRSELGEELFWPAIQQFVRDNAHKTVETVDLLRAIETATGRNLLFLFDQYVYRGGHPDYEVSYSWDGESHLAKLTVKQTQPGKHNLFDLRIPIGFGYQDGEGLVALQQFTVRIHEAEQSFYFPLTEKPLFISFDIGNNYLKTVTLKYPVVELKAQLELDPDPLSRIFAAQALAKKGGLEALTALTKALHQDKFWGVRVEVAKQIAKIKLDQSLDALLSALGDTNPYVRKAVVEALSQIKTHQSYQALKNLLKNGDRSYYVEAAAAKGLGAVTTGFDSDKSQPDKVIKHLTKVLAEKAGWNEVVRSGAIAGLAELKTSSAALDIILEYTKLGVPQPLRLAAIRALGQISTGQASPDVERVLNRLSELAQESFFLTQVAVCTSLGKMETPKAITILRSLSHQTPDGRVRRLADEEINRIQEKIGKDTALRQLRTEIDQLKQQNQELRSRLEELEAKSKSC